MSKVNLIIWCLVLSFLFVAINEMKRLGMVVERMTKTVYDLDLEVSRVTASNGYLGYIGERDGAVSVMGKR